MSKREELIKALESKLERKKQVDRRFQQNPLSWAPEHTDQRVFQANIDESSRLNNEIYETIEFIKMLPKENTPEMNKKRDNIISSLESKIERLRSLNSQLSQARSQPFNQQMVGVLNNQISDLNSEIDALQKLLSVL